MADFVYFDSPQVPLKEVPYGDIKENLIDPTTNKPYRGIVLEGVFAQFSNTPNNNKRIYSIPEYLVLLEKLKKEIHSPKGVYGELEHPEKYSVNFNNVSHKILDVWFDEDTLSVKGRLIILDTPKGKIAQEIIKSGGQLAISARAAGEEIQQSDGTFKAVTKLLTTYDLVYHPGFSAAVLEFKELNESQKLIQEAGQNKQGFAFKVYKNQMQKIPEAYLSYISMNESVDGDLVDRRSKCFLEWFSLNEQQQEQSAEEQKADEKILEKNETPEQKEKEENLKKAVQQDLKESFFKQFDKYHNKRKLAGNVYDDSAGFVTDGIDTTGCPEGTVGF